MADTTTANAQVRTLSETVRLDARTKLLNPKFYEGMLKSGYEGTREITKRLRNTMGWSATAGESAGPPGCTAGVAALVLRANTAASLTV